LFDVRSAAVNDADHIVAGRKGWGRDAGIETPAHQHVGECNSRGKNPDAHLVRAGIAYVIFD
jgi:hypothetical protein